MAKTPNKLARGKVSLFFLILMVVATALLVRITYIQVVRGSELTSQANDTRIQEKTVMAQRGVIYDRNYNVLSTSLDVSTVIVNPVNLLANATIAAIKEAGGERDAEGVNKVVYDQAYTKEVKAISKKLAGLLDLKAADLQKKLTDNAESQYLILKRNVNKDTVEKLKEVYPNSLSYESTMRRNYPYGSLAAHVLGLVGDDGDGLTGLELSYNDYLKGQVGYTLTEVDADGRALPQGEYTSVNAHSGSNLVLTLDATIQYYVEKSLDKVMQEHDPACAVILVANPKTGEILAMGSRPSYAPDQWSQYSQEIYSRNPAVNYTYEPGSTFKIVSAVTALEEGLVTPEENFYCGGAYTITGVTIKCANEYGHGAETFAQGVANSCNPVYIQVGLRTGKTTLYKYVRAFGFGQTTGIDLPGEEQGLMIDENTMVPVELAAMSIGQSIVVTPVQVLRAACTIANQGKLVKLHLVDRVEDDQEEVLFKYDYAPEKQIISKQTSSTMLELMKGVVLNGTASKAFIEGYSIAGKTGTAEMAVGSGGYASGKYVSSFVGIAPADDPQIAVLIMVAEPSKGTYYGSLVAAPVFADLGKNILNYLGIMPDYSLPVPEGYTSSAQDASEEVYVLNEIPNVVGMTLADAQSLLEAKGFAVQLNGESGLVQRQSPQAGEKLGQGGEVWLTVQEPEDSNQIKMPDLSGLSLKNAGAVVEHLGLKITYTGSGYVVKQSPEAGKTVEAGSTIKVSLAAKVTPETIKEAEEAEKLNSSGQLKTDSSGQTIPSSGNQEPIPSTSNTNQDQ